MPNKIIQAFLDKGLFNIDDDQKRVGDIEASVKDLIKLYKEQPHKLISHTLVALDPDITEDEPVILEIEEIVKKERWTTLRSKFKDTPRTLLRGVILGALYEVRVDPLSARIIYLTGTNFFPFAKLGHEGEVIRNLLQELGEITEQAAISEWELVEEDASLKISGLKISNLKFGEIKVDGSPLKTKLSQTNQRFNLTYHANQISQWAPAFAEEIGNGVAELVSTSLNGFSQGISPNSLEEPINKFFSDFKKSLDTTMKNTFKTISAIDRRNKLLWWKEALYSISTKKGYREIRSCELPFLLAFDLSELVPQITPVSMDYFLRDTVLVLDNESMKESTFEKLIGEITLDKEAIIKNCFKIIDQPNGRISLTSFLRLLFNNKVSIEEMQRRTGFDLKAKVTPSDVSVMVFHDLLSEKNAS